MIIHNIRLGFATNSSSAHSLIFLRNVKDHDIGGFEFGWENFVAASKNARRAYLANTIGYALREHVDNDTAALITKQLVGRRCGTYDTEGGYIDHQSIYTLPYNWSGNGLDYEFIKEFSEFLLQKDLVILGGNDNDGPNHPLDNGTAFILPVDRDGDSKNWIAKKDPQGFWTLFNKDTGAKIRMSFPIMGDLKGLEESWRGQIAGIMHPEYSTTPDLIDIKITDYCERGCSYCYQDSTKAGKHADLRKNSWAFTDALKRLQVFEVAIGGGEPTKHPDFIRFIKELRRSGITPNFSTRDLSWMDKADIREEILDNIGSFAYSVNSAWEIEELAARHRVFCGDRIREPSIHYVMGMGYDFERILETASHHGFDVVLLDYKGVGRGRNCPEPSDYDDWIDVVLALREQYKCPNISIDTALAARFKNELRAAGIDDIFINDREGAFNMYIDLVEGVLGPSSFCEKDQMLPFDTTAYSDLIYEQISTAFRTF